jgi:uncharacterized membrane protein YGL010W
MYTVVMLLNFVPFSLAFKGTLVELNLAWLVVIPACVGYIKINKESGVISTMLYTFVTLIARGQYMNARDKGELSSLFWQTVTIKVVAWALQIVGHKVFESRSG